MKRFFISLLLVIITFCHLFSQASVVQSDSLVKEQISSLNNWINSHDLGKVLIVDTLEVSNNGTKIFLRNILEKNESDSLKIYWDKYREIYRKVNPRRIHSKMLAIFSFYLGKNSTDVSLHILDDKNKEILKIYHLNGVIKLEENFTPSSMSGNLSVSIISDNFRNPFNVSDTITRKTQKNLRYEIAEFLTKKFKEKTYKKVILSPESKVKTEIKRSLRGKVECTVSCLYDEVLSNEEFFEKIFLTIHIITVGKNKFTLELEIDGMYDGGFYCNPNHRFFKGITKLDNRIYYEMLNSYGEEFYGELIDNLNDE